MKKIVCHEGLPLEYESFLIEKYNSFMTTCRYLEIHYPRHTFHFMLVYEDDGLLELLLFGNLGSTASCFNSLVSLQWEVVELCSRELFLKYPIISKIKVEASYTKYDFQKAVLFSRLDDHILNLPVSMEDYFKSIGSSTRQHVRNRKVRLLRDFPNTRFVARYGEEIDEEIMNKIVQLNYLQLRKKGRVSGIDESYKRGIYMLCRHYGCVTYIEVDNEIIAGSLNTVLNKHAFGHVTAFDPSFAKYSVGEICAFFLIEIAIEKGITNLHFLWGTSDLKKRLLAQPYLLFSYYIYKDFTIDYYIKKASIKVTDVWIRLKDSRLSIPLRHAVAVYRKNNWKLFLTLLLVSDCCICNLKTL